MSADQDNRKGSGGTNTLDTLNVPKTDTSRRFRLPRTTTKEEMMKDASVPIARSIIDNIDMTLWYKPITKDSEDLHVTTMVARGISSLSAEGLTDDELLEAYQDQFEGWGKDLFDRAGEAKRALKALLRQGGIYTGRRNGSIGRQLDDLLTMEELPEWDLDDFQKAKFDIRSDAYRRQQALQQPQDQRSNLALHAQNENRQSTAQAPALRPPPQRQQPPSP
jgi:hypothetical protein